MTVPSCITELKKELILWWSKNVEEALGGRSIDYIVVQHMEPDHAGSLLHAIQKYPDAIVVGNAKTFLYIKQFFEIDLTNRTLEVKEGDTLSLGSHELTFIMAPMLLLLHLSM